LIDSLYNGAVLSAQEALRYMGWGDE